MNARVPPPLETRLHRIYDVYRTLSLSERYNAYREQIFERIDTAFEVVIGLGSGSGVAGLFFWKTNVGHEIWLWLSALPVILVILRRVFGIKDKIKSHASQRREYTRLFLETQEFVAQIEEDQEITAAAGKRWAAIVKKYHELELKDDGRPSRRVLRKLQDEVNEAIPVKNLWFP